ncbi:PIN domain-containing protein [Chryseobacterium arthrosphaerae]|uniref:PIN domain-containing protein n=1 Tax=Chryseobacterium arthrosphaerae TaxID=651561 RepID=A0ABU7R6P6_9FLAO|nr:PIN domain-containing protein [Chryseobacterium arthrosphaerae]
MTNIILDTNIILKQPKVLGLQIPELHFLIPLDVIEELNVRATQRGASFDRRIDIIEKASHQGTVSIINPDAPAYRQYRELVNANKLSGADIAIVAIALSLTNKGEKVKIATQDKEIWRIAKEHGIDILLETDVNNLLTNFIEPKTNTTDTVQKEIVTYEKKEKRNFFTGIFTGAMATLIATIIYQNIDKIIETINVWGTILVILIAGIGLFVFRERKRLSYGVFEFLVGVVAIIMLFQPTHFKLSTLNFDLDFNIRILGGLYIMVRGQDNIIKGIKDTKIGLHLKDKYGIGR